MTWQPIETAPINGIPVLLYFPGGTMRIACWKDRGPYGLGWREPTGNAEQATILGAPSHWMRLPDPPRESRAGRSTKRSKKAA